MPNGAWKKLVANNWPVAIDRIFSSPLVSLFGVGEPHILFELVPGKYSPPHNAFLHFALSSGVVPFAFFLWLLDPGGMEMRACERARG